MTCGIYKLVFENTDKVYIGQSVNIERRYKEHVYQLCNKLGSKKLQEAYLAYKLPQLNILQGCDIEELANLERECIDIYNSVDNGFNSIRYTHKVIGLQGPEHGSSKYSTECILQVFYLLVNSTELTYIQISNILNVSINVIAQIASLKSHLWLQEYDPTSYDILINLKNNRNKTTSDILDSRSSKSKGIIQPMLRSPDGTTYLLDNVRKFCREHNLHNGSITAVLKGQRYSCKGWVICQEEPV